MRKICIIVLALLAFGGFEAAAQRVIPGQIAFDFGGTAYTPYGAEIGVQLMRRTGKITVRASAFIDNKASYGSWYETDPQEHTGEIAELDTRNLDLAASCGYMWCFAHNRTRSVNLWGGCSLDVGARLRHLKTEGYELTEIPAATFALGLSPELNFEWFPAGSFSMSVFFRPHCQFLFRGSGYSNDTRERWFFPQTGIQFNFYLFAGK